MARSKTETKEHSPNASLPATELISHLDATGTSPQRLKPFIEWAKEQGDKATAGDLYRHLEEQGVPAGTLRKAGKWVHGDGFEPERAAITNPSDEITQLRETVARLEAKVREGQSRSLGLQKANNFLREQNEELTKKVAYVKASNGNPALALAE